MHGLAFAPAGLGLGEPVLDQKYVKRRNHEQHGRVAHQSIRETFPAGRLQIFLHRQSRDVTHPAPIQIAGTRMVGGMFPAPVLVGGEGQHAGDESPNVIRPA